MGSRLTEKCARNKIQNQIWKSGCCYLISLKYFLKCCSLGNINCSWRWRQNTGTFLPIFERWRLGSCFFQWNVTNVMIHGRRHVSRRLFQLHLYQNQEVSVFLHFGYFIWIYFSPDKNIIFSLRMQIQPCKWLDKTCNFQRFLPCRLRAMQPSHLLSNRILYYFATTDDGWLLRHRNAVSIAIRKQRWCDVKT